MDFEIEDSGDFDYSNDNNYSVGKKSMTKPKASMFGGSLENSAEEDLYNYEFEPSSKSKSTNKYSNDSGKSSYGNTSKPAASTKAQTDLRVSVSSNNSAMEKAQSLLSRYSQQGSLTQPKTNFKKGKARATFDEEDFSISMDDDDDENEESELNQMSSLDESDLSGKYKKPAAKAAAGKYSSTAKSSSAAVPAKSVPQVYISLQWP
jgi:hypothetical protein